ncbi:unnamed protein product [Closterium sp. NIES-64]|nr:unnamed protein product [Closterium sp. NIES-64]
MSEWHFLLESPDTSQEGGWYMARPSPQSPCILLFSPTQLRRVVHVSERNMLEWHFLLEGPPDTPFQGGWYVAKLRFPPDYPFRPPAILMLSPPGHFKTNTRLFLSISDFHLG